MNWNKLDTLEVQGKELEEGKSERKQASGLISFKWLIFYNLKDKD